MRSQPRTNCYIYAVWKKPSTVGTTEPEHYTLQATEQLQQQELFYKAKTQVFRCFGAVLVTVKITKKKKKKKDKEQSILGALGTKKQTNKNLKQTKSRHSTRGRRHIGWGLGRCWKSVIFGAAVPVSYPASGCMQDGIRRDEGTPNMQQRVHVLGQGKNHLEGWR